MILIVDNDPLFAQAIADKLREKGWSSVISPDWPAACVSLQQQDFVLVLLRNALAPVSPANGATSSAYEKIPPLVLLLAVGEEQSLPAFLEAQVRDHLLIHQKNFLSYLPRVVERVLQDRNTEKDLDEARSALVTQEERYRRIVEATADGIITYDQQGQITLANPAACALLGYSAEELLSVSFIELLAGQVTVGMVPSLVDLLEEGCKHQELQLRPHSGGLVWADLTITPFQKASRLAEGGMALLMDITHRKDFEARILQLANYDILTGLANRSLLTIRIRQAIKQARRHHCGVAVLFLDLDRFKTINDSLGHGVGDNLLIQVAYRLRNAVRENDTVARLGGDEFVVLLAELDTSLDASRVAQKILSVLAKPFMVEGHELRVLASIGISIYPEDAHEAEKLIRNADAAMYHAKNLGRGNYQYYTLDMNVRAYEALKLENQLNHAIERQEFVLHYQPQLDAASQRLIGFEALIRWHHPEKGLVAPAYFIQHAEERGLIGKIGNWVLQEACRQNRQWIEQGVCQVPVAVNLSASQFRHNELCEEIRGVLQSTGLEPQWLELEVTESTLMQDGEQVLNMLDNLRALGVFLSIDDFGTGYSSLSYLRRFSIDRLKIDRSFLREISVNRDDQAIVEAIIRISHSLGLAVLAEGVETLDQLHYLRHSGCNEVQGYLFSKPLPAKDIPAYVAQLPQQWRKLGLSE